MAIDVVNAQAGVPRVHSKKTLTIANGASLSGAHDMGGETPIAIEMPSAWTAAVLTFAASQDGTTYNAVFQDDGTELTAQAAASRYITLDAKYFLGIQDIKIRSGTSSTPVNQAAARDLVLICRPL